MKGVTNAEFKRNWALRSKLLRWQNPGNVTLSGQDERIGNTIYLTNQVSGMTVRGLIVNNQTDEPEDVEIRYVFTASADFSPTVTNVDYTFPRAMKFSANEKYMVCIIGRIVTWSEGV